MKAFKEQVVRTKYTSRRIILHDILNAVVKNKRLNGADVPETDNFMQAHSLMLSHPSCPKCGKRSQLKIHRPKRDTDFWCWTSPQGKCASCEKRQRIQIMKNTLCENVKHHLWSAWLDVFFMRSVDTPLPQIYAEYNVVKYEHLRQWITTCQQAAFKTAKNKINLKNSMGCRGHCEFDPVGFVQRCSRNPQLLSSGSQRPA
eukprot:6347797-Amphidinium_carterae.2